MPFLLSIFTCFQSNISPKPDIVSMENLERAILHVSFPSITWWLVMMSIQEFSTGPILSAQFHLLTPITSLSWERRRGRHYTPLLSLTLNHFSFASSPPYYLHQSSPSSAFSSLCCSPSLTFLLSAKISNASPTSTYSHILLNYLLQIHLFLYPFTQFKPLHKIIYYPPPHYTLGTCPNTSPPPSLFHSRSLSLMI